MDGGRPSRESLREVRREYRQRRRAARGKPPRGARGRRPGRVGALLKGTAVVAVVLAGAAAYVVWQVPPPPTGRAAQRVPVLVSPTPTPSAAATARPEGDPFAGTAVSHWPAGEAGFVAPGARATGGYDTATVAHAYERTLRYLRAAMLDRRVVYGADLRPVAATVQARSMTRLRPAYLATVFPRAVAPAHRSVRVNGLLSARVGAYGRLHVTFRYVGVYALRPARGGETELVVVRRTGELAFDRAGRGRVGVPFVHQTSYTSSHSHCGARWPDGDRTVEVWLGPGASPSVTAAPPARERVNLLDPRAKDAAGCFQNTGRL